MRRIVGLAVASMLGVVLAGCGSKTESPAEVAKSLGIQDSLLSKWITSSRTEGADAFRGHGKRTAVEEENWQLRLKVKSLEQELEFLKKVSRYFAKDPK